MANDTCAVCGHADFKKTRAVRHRDTPATCRDLHEWMGLEHEAHDEDCDQGICIETLEGVMTADVGDWIIRGVAGEFYPCKPDIFAATYVPAEKPETDT